MDQHQDMYYPPQRNRSILEKEKVALMDTEHEPLSYSALKDIP